MIARLAAALMVAAVSVPAQTAPPAKPPAPLFMSDSLLTMTVTTDLVSFVSNRDSLAPALPGKLRLTTSGGDSLASFDVSVRARGHFRRQMKNCDFPPVSLKFQGGVKGTVFARQSRLKLVTPCRATDEEYQQYVASEYLLYRVYNLITPFSFRARPVGVTYEDVHAKRTPIKVQGFLIENDDAMAERNSGEILEAKNAHREDLDSTLTYTFTLFEYFIANTDWSISGLHNVRLVRIPTVFGVVFPVPYDFDWAGAVSARYARPDPSLPISRVQDRLYRGYCTPAVSLAPAVAAFNAHRDAITALYRGQTWLDASRTDRTLKYFDDFFSTINDPKQLERAIKRGCLS